MKNKHYNEYSPNGRVRNLSVECREILNRGLFLCSGNSCGSQRVEGWVWHLAGDQFAVASAETDPKGMNPLAIETMKGVGIDMSNHDSTHIREFINQSFDNVITVCDHAREVCPQSPKLTHSSTGALTTRQ